MVLEFRFLGQFEIRDGSRVLTLKSRPAQSLVAYLLLNPGKTHRRERLAGILWPADREDSARANLRQLLWQIKKALGVDLFLADKIDVRINPETPFTLDVDQLSKSQESSVTLEKRLEALSLYSGELLPGFYDDWLTPERERVGQIYDQQMTIATQDLQKG